MISNQSDGGARFGTTHSGRGLTAERMAASLEFVLAARDMIALMLAYEVLLVSFGVGQCTFFREPVPAVERRRGVERNKPTKHTKVFAPPNFLQQVRLSRFSSGSTAGRATHLARIGYNFRFINR
jgi:hypothetical protein